MSGTRGDVKRPRMLASEWRAWVDREVADIMATERPERSDALSALVMRLEDGYYTGPGEHELTDRNTNHCLGYARQQLKEISDVE